MYTLTAMSASSCSICWVFGQRDMLKAFFRNVWGQYAHLYCSVVCVMLATFCYLLRFDCSVWVPLQSLECQMNGIYFLRKRMLSVIMRMWSLSWLGIVSWTYMCWLSNEFQLTCCQNILDVMIDLCELLTHIETTCKVKSWLSCVWNSL